MCKSNKESISVFSGSGNVFKDIGLPDADDLLVKAGLIVEVNRRLIDKSLTLNEVSKHLRLDNLQVEGLLNGRLSLVLTEQLLSLLKK